MLISLLRSARSLRKYLLIVVSSLLLISLVACSSSVSHELAAEGSSFRTLDKIRSRGIIKIGVFADKAPFGYKDASGQYAGYDVEYGNRLAYDLGVKPEYISVNAASRVEFLQNNTVDLILANFTVTPERTRLVDFANPYMKVSLGAVTSDSAPIRELTGFRDKKVIVIRGTTAESYLEETHPEIKLVRYDHYAEATQALTKGSADAWITDNTEALAFAAQNKGYSVTISHLGDVDTVAGAVAKGNSSLLDWINNHLVKLGKERFFHKNFDKTLRPIYGEEAPSDELVVEGGQL